jgi:hypothetical protein
MLNCKKSYLKIEHLEEENSQLKVDVELQKTSLKVEHLEEENNCRIVETKSRS